MLEPWHLPGLDGLAEERRGEERWLRGQTASGLPFRVPELDGTEAAAVAGAVRDAALRARAERSLAQVVRSIARAATRLADPADPTGEEAVELLVAELGWTRELAGETLGGMGEIWTEESLWRVLHSELPDPAVLEGYRPDPGDTGRRRHAAGPPLLFQVHAANVPGVAVTATLRGLLCRSGVLSRVSEAEPALLALFARTLAAEDPLLGASVATTWWPAEAAAPAWDAWVKRSGKAVVYGGEEAVIGVRGRLPAHVELVSYGPRLGVGVVLADAAEGPAAEGAARGLARDACAYEQQGCVSPRLVYVVGEAEPFAVRLAEALEAEARRIPPPPPPPAEAVAIRALRAEAEFAGYAEGRIGRMLGSSGDLAWTVVVSGSSEPLAGALRRVVRLCALDDPRELEALLRPLEGRIQSLGFAGARGLEEVAAAAARLGVSRLAPFGRIAWPPPDWRHDGRHQLLPLLVWTDWEG